MKTKHCFTLFVYLLLSFNSSLIFSQTTTKVGHTQLINFADEQVKTSNPLSLFQQQLKLDAKFGVLQKNNLQKGNVQRFQLTYEGVPLLHKHLILHSDGEYVKKIITNNISHLSVLSSEDVLNEKKALTILSDILNEKGLTRLEEETSLRKIYFSPTENSNAFILSYEISFFTNEPKRYQAFINAGTGALLALKAASLNCNSPGTAETVFSGQQDIIAAEQGDDFILHDCTRGGGIRTTRSGSNFGGGNFDLFDDDNVWGNYLPNQVMERYAMDAHWGVEQSFDYFYENYDYDVTHGEPLYSRISTALPYTGGAWYVYPDQVIFGKLLDESDEIYAFWSTPDIVGHEVTHGIVYHNADLVYDGEPGSIHEAYCDIFGVIIQSLSEPLDWLIGEDIIAVRSMSNPNAFEMPDTYQGQYYYTGDDSGILVHTNSSIINHWFYLLAEGGTGVNDNGDQYEVEALGMEETAGLMMELILGQLMPNTNFHEFRKLAILLAAETYGPCSDQVKSITNAFYAVGIGLEYNTQEPITNFTLDAATNCSAAFSWDEIGVPFYQLYYREIGTTNWQIISTISTTEYTITDLEPNTNYECYVTHPCDDPNPINPINFTTGGICPMVSNIIIEAVDYCSITFSWENNGAASYTFNYRSQGSTAPYIQEIVLTNGFTLSTPIIENSSTYDYFITSNCSAHCSGEDSPLQSFNLDFCAPNLTLINTHVTSCRAAFEWDVFPGQCYSVNYRLHLNDGTWTDYDIKAATDGLGYGSVSYSPGSVLQVEYLLTTTCKSGDCLLELPGHTIVVDVPDPNPNTTCTVPTNVQIEFEDSNGGNLINVHWDAPLTYDYFELIYRFPPSSNIYPATSNHTRHSRSTNFAYDCVEVELWTNCSCDNSGSTSDIITTTFCRECVAPLDMTISDLCANSIFVEFTLDPITYTIDWEYQLAGSGTWIDLPDLSFGTPGFEINGLTANSNYVIRARSKCGNALDADYSDYFITEFQTDDLCLIPENFEGIALDQNTAELTWSTINNAEYYEIEYREANSSLWYTAAIFGNLATIPFDLSQGAYFRIRSSCFSCSKSEWSEEIYLFEEYCPEVTFATCADNVVAGFEECTFYAEGGNPCSNGGFSGYVWLIDQYDAPVDNINIDWYNDGTLDTNPFYLGNPWMQNCSDIPVAIYNDGSCEILTYFNPDCCSNYSPVLECVGKTNEGWEIQYNQVCGVTEYTFYLSCLPSGGFFEEYVVPAGSSPQGIFTVPTSDLFCGDIVVTMRTTCSSGLTSPLSNCIIINYEEGYCTEAGECAWYNGPAYQIPKTPFVEQAASKSTVFPNPTDGEHFYINIFDAEKSLSKVNKVNVYTLDGKMVFEKELDESLTLHEVEADLLPGMYIVMLSGDLEKMDVHRLVVGRQ